MSIINHYYCWEKYVEHQSFLIHLLETIKNWEGRESDVGELIEYLNNLVKEKSEKLYVKSLPKPAINVLTIHQAKGLEFKVVILPFFSDGCSSNK